MALLILLTGVGCGIIMLTSIHWRLQQQMQQLRRALVQADEAAIASSRTENQLKDELTTLKQELDSAGQDPVTNLLGWPIFADRLNQRVKESVRYQLTMGVLYIDIDDFDVINKALGTSAADLVLQDVGHRLQSCIRQVDSITRFAKDTFVVLLSQLNKPEAAAIVAQRMLQVLAQPFKVNAQELYLTAGIGIAICPVDAQEVSSLLHVAEQAMRSAKKHGKHIYQFVQEKIHDNSKRELALSISFRSENLPLEFLIYYQSIMDVVENKMYGTDALLKWQHPELGMIEPDELLQSAIRQGKVNVLTEYLLKRAGEQFLYWRQFAHPPAHLVVPLFVKQLENSHFIYRISQIMQDLGLKPEWLIFRICAQPATVIEWPVLMKAINMLKYLNVKLALDNFGRDAYSLRDLTNIPVDVIKLDPALVADLTTNARQVVLLRSLIALAQNMGMTLIVPGVVSSEQYAIVLELGCHLLQGSFISPPLPESEVTEKLVACTLE